MPSFFDLGGSVGKRFKVTEKSYFDFRTEFFNLFNHASFGPPERSPATPATFGLITTQANAPRGIFSSH